MQKSTLYLKPLDGLRFFAFLAVFTHHFPGFAWPLVANGLHNRGWVGVELFFIISSFLFFHLLNAEYEKTGAISAKRFYIRRLLRIYPLMVIFPLGMILYFGPGHALAWQRLAGIALFADNLMAWFGHYNAITKGTSHLWTLSFEFQVYLFIPLVFLLYKRFGKRAFLSGLAGVFIYCFLLRMTFYAGAAKHPLIWVTPFLRPESVLMGMALFVIQPKWPWWWSAVVSVLAGAAFFNMPNPWDTALASALSYPLAAIMCGGLMDAGLRWHWGARALSISPLIALGRISFGLYVFHYFCIILVMEMLQMPHGPVAYLATLGLTIVLATISFFGMEYWIDKLKARFAVVEGRGAPALVQPA